MIIDPLETAVASRLPAQRREPVERGFSFQDDRSWMSQSTGACRAESLGPDWTSPRRGMRLTVTLPCNDEGGVVQ